MDYSVKAAQDGKGYWKVLELCELCELSAVEGHFCDMGTESLFIDTTDHTNISLSVAATACSDIEEQANGEIRVSMRFKDNLPGEIIEAVESGTLFLSEL